MTIRSLNVNLNARIGNFVKGMTKAGTRLTRFGAKLTRVAAKARQLTSALARVAKKALSFRSVLVALTGGAGIVLLIRQQYKLMDSISKTADKLGLTTEALVGFHHAARLSGVATTTFDMAFQRLTRRLAEAAVGTGEAKAALKELGVDAAVLVALRPDKAFMAIADALNKVHNQSHRVRLAFKLFDSEGVAMVNMTREGTKGLMAMREETEKLGTAFSRLKGALGEQVINAWTRLMEGVTGLARNIAIRLGPYLTAVFDWLTTKLPSVHKIIAWVATIIPKVLATIADAMQRVVSTILWVAEKLVWAIRKIARARGFDELANGLLEIEISMRTQQHVMDDWGKATTKWLNNIYKAAHAAAAAVAQVPNVKPQLPARDFFGGLMGTGEDEPTAWSPAKGAASRLAQPAQAAASAPGLAAAAMAGSVESYSAIARAQAKAQQNASLEELAELRALREVSEQIWEGLRGYMAGDIA